MKSQKGFIPIIFIIIGAVVVASATFGVIKYKDEITANVSKVFKGSKVEVLNIDSTEGDELTEEAELVEEPIIEEPEALPESEIKERLKELSQTIKPELNKEEQNEPEETTPEVQPEPQNQEIAQEPEISEEEKEFQKVAEELIKHWQADVKGIITTVDKIVEVIDSMLSRISILKSVVLGMQTNFLPSDDFLQALNNWLETDANFLIAIEKDWDKAKEFFNSLLSYSTPIIENSNELEAATTDINNHFMELKDALLESSQKHIIANIDRVENSLDEIAVHLKEITEGTRQYIQDIAREEEQRYQQFLERTTPKPKEIDVEAYQRELENCRDNTNRVRARPRWAIEGCERNVYQKYYGD